MNCRWNTKNITTSGIVASVEIAMMCGKFAELGAPAKVWIPMRHRPHVV